VQERSTLAGIGLNPGVAAEHLSGLMASLEHVEYLEMVDCSSVPSVDCLLGVLGFNADLEKSDIRKGSLGQLYANLYSETFVYMAEAWGTMVAHRIGSPNDPGSRSHHATKALTTHAYKEPLVSGSSDDIVYTNYFTGVLGNYLRSSITQAAGSDNLPVSDPGRMNFADTGAKAWKDIWDCGQGVGLTDKIVPVGQYIARMKAEYEQAKLKVRTLG